MPPTFRDNVELPIPCKARIPTSLGVRRREGKKLNQQAITVEFKGQGRANVKKDPAESLADFIVGVKEKENEDSGEEKSFLNKRNLLVVISKDPT